MRHYKSQLRSAIGGLNGGPITAAGGKVFVANAGLPTKCALLTAAGATLANPITPTNGSIEFFTADTVATVDLYIQTPSGHFHVVKGVSPSGNASINVDISKSMTTMIIPVSAVDQSADATETTTGFSLPVNSIFLPVAAGLSVDVAVLESGKTVSFGTAEAIAETGGDADGMAAALSTTTVATVLSAVSTGILTATHVTITSTFSAGAVAAGCFLKIPLMLPQASL